MCLTFPNEKKENVSAEEKPHSLVGIFTHDHGKDVAKERVPKAHKDSIDYDLEYGLTPRKVYQNWEHPLMANAAVTKPITFQYIADRKRTRCPDYHEPTDRVQDGLLKHFQGDFVRRLNVDGFLDFKHTELPSKVQEKIIDTKRPCIVMANNEMVNRLKKHPTTLFLDATHNTNSLKCQLIDGHVLDDYEMSFPVGLCIAQSEDSDAAGALFKTWLDLCQDPKNPNVNALKNVKVIVTDMTKVYKKGKNVLYLSNHIDSCRLALCNIVIYHLLKGGV